MEHRDMKHICNYCKGPCIKKGIRNNIQKYACKYCLKYQQASYTYKVISRETENNIILLTKEAMSISSISRILKLSKSTVQRKLLQLSAKIQRPVFKEVQQEYELDEMTVTIAGEKNIYLIYAINRDTRKVIDFCIGNRTKLNIKQVVDTVLAYDPKKVFTDGLNSYPPLIPSYIHCAGRHTTNRIERMNLTLRNSIKRLTRCTIAFSRTEVLLNAVIKLVCWI